MLGNVQYTYNSDGSINWRAMIDNKHLVINKDVFPEGADVPSDISQLDDGQMLLLLAGYKELANTHVSNTSGFGQKFLMAILIATSQMKHMLRVFVPKSEPLLPMLVW